MKNKKIVFANQKGGVGKSTLCILFANYLAAKGKDVCIIDTDLQKTILMQRRKDKLIYEGEEEPYNVQDFDVTDVETMQTLVDSASQVEGFVLFDSPGNISEDGLAPLFVGADYIVCPYEYEDKALDSTGVFVQVLNVLREHNPQMTAQLFFVPNRIDPRIGTAEEQEMWRRTESVCTLQCRTAVDNWCDTSEVTKHLIGSAPHLLLLSRTDTWVQTTSFVLTNTRIRR